MNKLNVLVLATHWDLHKSFVSALILQSILDMLKFSCLGSPLDLCNVSYPSQALIEHPNTSILFQPLVNHLKCSLCFFIHPLQMLHFLKTSTCKPFRRCYSCCYWRFNKCRNKCSPTKLSNVNTYLIERSESVWAGFITCATPMAEAHPVFVPIFPVFFETIVTIRPPS